MTLPPTNILIWKTNYENCSDLIFAALSCEEVIIVPGTNYTTSAMGKSMFDMPVPGSFQNISHYI